jgi:acyl transferase domain-containing protein/acetyl esterase/lipase/acyl carrier protein/ubiquinone/menaquinone biosynthesis C-methylase UbiE
VANQHCEQQLANFMSQAYISSINDAACVTVTLRDVDVDDFIFKVRGLGLRATPVPVHGRFHTIGHRNAVDRLMEFVRREKELQLPDVKQLQTLVRSTIDGSIIVAQDEDDLQLTRIALESALLKPAHWYATLKASTQQIATSSDKTVAFAGFGNHIPTSLVQSSSLVVLSLHNLRPANVNLKANSNRLNGINGVHDSIHETHAVPVTASDDLSEYPSHSIAIVGMAGRFPGADSVDELWDLLLARRSTVEPAPVERFRLPQTGDHAKTKWWGNFLHDPEAFDHRFFKKSSREAIAWDPQQRILLEVVYEALESAGYFGPAAQQQPDDYGCYIGAVMNNYYDNVSCHPATAYATLGTSRCFISGCMSHYFGWTGPSLTIDTACSSSLVALNTACRAIWSGECSRAIAGGTNVISSPFDYQNLAAAGFLSPSGQCKPFDAAADGYCRGEAVAVVVLKRLSDALRDGDTVHGVVVGSAANQNHNSSHITVPQPESQVALYQDVMRQGGVEPEQVSYVEAHGTGTGVGDPVEVRSIREAFGGPQRDEVLHFGSVKGNIGHTEATAGIAGLIKVLLMMRHGRIPPQASHTELNPKLPPFGDDKMAIPKSVLDWSPGAARVACVNSYGAAGSNSAVVVRERPSLLSATAAAPVQLATYPLFIAANSANSLSLYSRKLLSWLKDTTPTATTPVALLSSLTFNLADRANHTLPFRLATTVSSLGDLETKLEAVAAGSGSQSDIISPPAQGKPQPAVAVLVFGGQESNFIGLSEDVYHSSKVFRHHLGVCNDLVVSQGRASLLPMVFQREPVQDLVALHAGLFAVQYASAKAWLDCGLKVAAVVGHSFGQLTAFCISGVLSVADALKLVIGRAEIMEKHWGTEPGSMLFIQADRETVEQALRSLKLQGKQQQEQDGSNTYYAEIACYNGTRSHVVVGSAHAIDLLEDLVGGSARTKKLNVTHGFHSKFTEPMLEHIAALAQRLEWRRPSIHLETCNEVESQTEPDSHIAAEHTRRPVFFQRAIERLAARFTGSTCAWVEAGRGSSVMKLVRGCVPDAQTTSQSEALFLSPQLTTVGAQASLADSTVQLWKRGLAAQYWGFHRSQKAEFGYVSLPPYQFEKTRHWLPFTGRGENEQQKVPHQGDEQAAPETHELLTFLHYKDSGNKQAVFRIDPHADRFQTMLGGHVMGGQTLAPASLYFEVVARAALRLQDDVAATTYVPTVNDLVMMSPIGQDTNKTITLTLTPAAGADGEPAWTFSIATQDTASSAAPFEQSTGMVRLRTRTDAGAARAFGRFEALTGHGRRVAEVLTHPDAETMRGRHVYRAFDTVVHYGPTFQGIKEVSCVGHEAAGTVRATPDPTDPADQRLCDTPMTDSFMQFAGFLVNYFNNEDPDNLYVCQKIEHIEMGGGFDPDAGEWRVFSTMTTGGAAGDEEGGHHVDATADAYVFDVRTGKMVMAAFGFRFSRIPRALLIRLLKSVNKTKSASAETHDTAAPVSAAMDASSYVKKSTVPKKKKSMGPKKKAAGPTKRPELLQILANVTDRPLSEITPEAMLEDLGVDSLMATEVLNDIRTGLGLTIDLTSFLFFPNIEALAVYVDEQLGLGGGSNEPATDDDEDDTDDENAKLPASRADSGIGDVNTPGTTSPARAPPVDVPRPTITNALEAFRETRLNYDHLAKVTQAVDFWKDAYPHQKRLVLAYVVEAFARIGCDLKVLRAGDVVPQVQGTLERHGQLLRQFYRVLEDGALIEADLESLVGRSSTELSFIRTNIPVDPVPAEDIYHEIVDLHPQHATVTELVRAVGSELAPCLTGAKDCLQVLFGNRVTKKTLEDMYEFLPLLRTPALVLGDFLAQALTRASGGGTFRILEVGAGTGGTTRYLIGRLRSLGIPFQYTFSDLSASLVGAAKKQFKELAEDGTMQFRVLDIEQPPAPEDTAAYHIVLATNCIHATHNLAVSLRHLRRMLRDDGALTLIEITQNMFWLDVVVGLLEGWWLFEDGREHALVDERHWARVMKAAGFAAVEWSDGESPESKTVRLIGAFPTAKATTSSNGDNDTTHGPVVVVNGALPTKRPAHSDKAVLETVVYKTVDGQDIHADVYWPVGGPVPESNRTQKARPIALMIHGGSHIIFSRKDIRPAQTRLLLSQGFLPVSLDHRLCPEVPLAEGAMADVCSALAWARDTLPNLASLSRPAGLQIDGTRVVVVGWSSGGQLALSLNWTAPARGLAPPTAVLAFYAPTDYEDPWWRAPIQPDGAADTGLQYDVLEAVQDTPLTNYGVVGAWEPLSDPRILTDPRCRIVLHINWKAQTLPVIINGLPSRAKADAETTAGTDWNAAPQPTVERIRAVSPRAHISRGSYASVPTFLIHGTADDLIPWHQSRGTYDALVARGVPAGLALIEGAPHICDLSSDPESEGWKAALRGYEFLASFAL